jgi:hypothetical protein
MLKAKRRAARSSLKRVLGRRPAGVSLLTSQHIAKKADGAEARRARKQLAAARTGALGFRAHGLTPHIRSPRRKQRNAPPSGAKAAQHSTWQTVVPLHKESDILHNNASNQVAARNTPRSRCTSAHHVRFPDLVTSASASLIARTQRGTLRCAGVRHSWRQSGRDVPLLRRRINAPGEPPETRSCLW